MSDEAKRQIDPEWLSIREVARRLSVSQRQVKKWMAGGQFRVTTQFGPRLRRISRASYEEFVQRNTAA